MQRRVPPSEQRIAGALLVRSTSGGYSIMHAGDYIGYVHASVGNQWNAYRRMTNELDTHLGRLSIEEAVRAVLRSCGRVNREEAA
jgi:hypothetical protein